MLSLLVLISTAIPTAEAKKPKTPPPPPVGWHREPAPKGGEGWKGDCYFPPAWEALGEGDRKIARQVALEEMKKQWLGAREDGVTMNETIVDEVDTVLLGRPQQIEPISLANLEQCKAVMSAGADSTAWSGWLSSLPAQLTKGECNTPLTYTLFDYLDVGKSWQRPITLCKGNKAKISASAKDRYRITETGQWMTVLGDVTQKATGADWPCNIEGCNVGMLVGKFVTESGVETIFPIGEGTVFTAPEHGTLSYSINDTVWYDNKWFKSATIEDKTAITIEPG